MYQKIHFTLKRRKIEKVTAETKPYEMLIQEFENVWNESDNYACWFYPFNLTPSFALKLVFGPNSSISFMFFSLSITKATFFKLETSTGSNRYADCTYFINRNTLHRKFPCLLKNGPIPAPFLFIFIPFQL